MAYESYLPRKIPSCESDHQMIIRPVHHKNSSKARVQIKKLIFKQLNQLIFTTALTNNGINNQKQNKISKLKKSFWAFKN